MKTIKLKTLTLKHFKGVRDFTLETEGKDIAVYGDNRTGKSTLADAVMWLLFGKDSLNQANFEIKTIEGGETLHGLDHAVEAVFEVGKKAITLRKTYKEQWVKRRGSAHKEFTGHIVDHAIDGVPVKKKEFDEAVKDICPEDLFRLLSDPRHFNVNLHWQDRRKMLLAVCGDVSDSDVIASDKELADLTALLNGKSMDDVRKIVKARQSEINKELDRIPVRIDEITASRIESPRDPKTVQAVIEVCKGNRQELVEKLNQIENGGEIAALQKQVAEIDAKIIAAQNEADEANRKARAVYDDKRRALVVDANVAADALDSLNRELANAKSQREDTLKGIASLEKRMEDLRQEWHETNGQRFDGEETCPTCGQALPHERVQAAQEAHNAAKAKVLADISANGKTAKDAADKLRGDLEGIDERIAVIEADIDGAQSAVAAAKGKIDAHDQEPVRQDAPDTGELEGAKAQTIARIAAIKEGAADGAAEVKEQIAAVDADIEKHQAELLSVEANKRIAVRIEELKKQERELAAEFEANERTVCLIEKFVRAKVAMLEESINSHFKMVRWKLFSENINGGLEETCVATIDGVPYPSANNEARINAGIDIANAFAKHHGIAPFIIVDNAEAVTRLLPSEAQQIRLVVSEADKELRVAA